MGQQFRIKRTIGTIPVVAGGAATIDLPRGYDYEALYLRLYGGLQVTVNFASVRAENPCQMIARAEIIADGRNTIYSAPFWFATLANYGRNANQSGARATTPASGFVVATYQVEANGIIDFQTPDGERPKDSNFRTSQLQLFQLRLTFGNVADCFTGAGTGNVSNLNVEISTSEMVEIPDAAGNVTSPTALKKVSFQEIALPGVNPNQELRLPAGNLIKSIVNRFEAATGEPSTAILNSIQAFSGVDVRQNMSAAALRGENNNNFGAVQSGYYILDFARSCSNVARLSELWDVTRQAEPKLSMNVTGAAGVKMQAVTTEYLGLK